MIPNLGMQWLIDMAYIIAERLRAAGYRVNLVIDPMGDDQ